MRVISDFIFLNSELDPNFANFDVALYFMGFNNKSFEVLFL